MLEFYKLFISGRSLFVHLRIGPYACAEWNYGGFPLWLHFIPGIVFRSDNEPFKAEMQRFTAKIVVLMEGEKLYVSQGGPIILSQIENEYGNIQSGYGIGADPYIKWVVGMVVSLDTGVPWVMCQQDDAPDPITDRISIVDLSLVPWGNTQISPNNSWHGEDECQLDVVEACAINKWPELVLCHLKLAFSLLLTTYNFDLYICVRHFWIL